MDTIQIIIPTQRLSHRTELKVGQVHQQRPMLPIDRAQQCQEGQVVTNMAMDTLTRDLIHRLQWGHQALQNRLKTLIKVETDHLPTRLVFRTVTKRAIWHLTSKLREWIRARSTTQVRQASWRLTRLPRSTWAPYQLTSLMMKTASLSNSLMSCCDSHRRVRYSKWSIKVKHGKTLAISGILFQDHTVIWETPLTIFSRIQI